MWKLVILCILALVLGAMAGGVAVQAKLKPAVAAAHAEHAQTLSENATLKQRVQETETRLARLEKENTSLRWQLDSAQTLAEARTAETAPPVAAPADIELEEALDPKAAPPPRAPLERRDRDGRGRDRDRDDGPRDGRGEWEALDPAEREARRQEFADRARQRVDEATAEAMAKTSDAAAQERLAALNEQVNYMMDLAQSMRDAQTEEDRQALRETMSQTRDTIRALSEQQQDYMLRQLASQYGITAPGAQDQFISSLRETQQNPVFQGSRAFMGGGWGGFRGGPGGGQTGANSNAAPPR